MGKLSCAVLATFALVAALNGAEQRTAPLSSHAEHPGFTSLPASDSPLFQDILDEAIDRLAERYQWMDTTHLISAQNTVCLFNVETRVSSNPFQVYPGSFSGAINMAGAPSPNPDGSPGIILFTAPAGPSTLPMAAYMVGPPATLLAEIGQIPGGAQSGYQMAIGDFTGDATPEFAVTPGNGSPGAVHVFSPGTDQMLTFYPYGQTYTQGIRIAAGDINGNGHDDLLFTQIIGREFKAYEVRDLNSEPALLGYGDPFGPTFSLGAQVSAFDFNFDGFDEAIFATGGGQPMVRIINFNAPSPQLVTWFNPGNDSFTGGIVSLAVGVVNGAPAIGTVMPVGGAPTRQDMALHVLQRGPTRFSRAFMMQSAFTYNARSSTSWTMVTQTRSGGQRVRR